jgi:hypothetical protein
MLGMCCLAMGVVSLFVLSLLPSNVSVRHNVLFGLIDLVVVAVFGNR